MADQEQKLLALQSVLQPTEKDGIADELRRQLRLEKIKRKRIQNDLKQSSKKLKRVTKELKKVNHLDHERLKARDRFWDFLDELFEAGEISEGERDRRWKESVEFGRAQGKQHMRVNEAKRQSKLSRLFLEQKMCQQLIKQDKTPKKKKQQHAPDVKKTRVNEVVIEISTLRSIAMEKVVGLRHSNNAGYKEWLSKILCKLNAESVVDQLSVNFIKKNIYVDKVDEKYIYVKVHPDIEKLIQKNNLNKDI